MKSEPEVDLYVFKWHFGFRVANLWLIIIGGSIINKIDPFIEDPGSIVDLLGVSVPGKSQVWIFSYFFVVCSMYIRIGRRRSCQSDMLPPVYICVW